MSISTPRSREADAFLLSRQNVAPNIVSACAGWTAHEVTAHLTGIVIEVSRHLSPYLAGELVPPTRSFEEREAPLQATSDHELLALLVQEEERWRTLMDATLAKDIGAVIPWTGRQMAVAKFWPHLRNEFSIHRWDITGDDDTSLDLLAQPDLTEHAVEVLGEILVRRGRKHDPSPDEPFDVRLRSGNTADVRLIVDTDSVRLELSDQADGPTVHLDPGARTLVLWGRRPDHRGRFTSNVDQPTLARLQTLLSGY
jgi:uncharacterized protein (TIGR03083 family)